MSAAACSLDVGDPAPEPTVPMALTGLVASSHSCGLAPDGAAWCWGNNVDHQLGDSLSIVATQRVPIAVRTTVKFTKLAAGLRHTCGISTAGAAWCWGSNTFGQLGDSTNITRAGPVAVSTSLLFAEIDAGFGHTCGLTTTGDIYCWGDGTYGQLGNGAFASSKKPVKAGSGFQALTLGDYFACGLASGTAMCWGLNSFGALGTGSPAQASNTPVAVSGVLNFASLTSGAAHTCGVTQAGAAWCWGKNEFGQVSGDTLNTDRSVPVAVNTTLAFKYMAPGNQQTCALTTDGAAWCWGYNGRGALGDATFLGRTAPVQVVGGLKFNRIASSQHTCGDATDGIAYCWGRNNTGQLGDGLELNRPGPAPVRTP